MILKLILMEIRENQSVKSTWMEYSLLFPYRERL